MNILSAFRLWQRYKRPINEVQSITQEITQMNLSFLQALKSRTVWVTLIGGAIHLFPQVQSLIPPGIQPAIDAGLTLLAILFRMNPKQGTVPVAAPIDPSAPPAQ
jgi:hypothetical protein